MVVIVPLLMGGLNFAVNTVHEAQQVLTIGYDDRAEGDPIATIYCKRIGLKSDVYKGINRVSLRYGCGMSDDENGVRFAGYSSGAFKPLLKVKKNDIITISNNDGETMYQVTDISSKVKDVGDGYIVLSTSKNNSPFSYYDSEKLFVTAKEVLYE